MKAGGDKDGIWTLLGSGMRCVNVPCARLPCIFSPFLRVSAIASHVPYMIGFLLSAIGGGGALKRLINFGQESVLKRLEIGANRKDLFYYLVRQYIVCPTCSHH